MQLWANSLREILNTASSVAKLQWLKSFKNNATLRIIANELSFVNVKEFLLVYTDLTTKPLILQYIPASS